MPNTDPPITTRQQVLERLELVDKAKSPVLYGLYIGVTSDEKQLMDAVSIHRELFPKVVGLKMFAGKSVGNLSVTKEEDQKKVYKILADAGYLGVIVVHCEKESYFRDCFNPNSPITHSYSRPRLSEIWSVNDQIGFAKEAGFKGHIHIAHVSVHDSVRIINDNKNHLKLSCGITPHHYVFSSNDVFISKNGLLFKVNPPIRDIDNVMLLRGYLKRGLIDLIETDHAPHTFAEKTSHKKEEGKYLSGFPGLPFLPHFIRYLETKEEFSKEQINDLTHKNAERIFGITVPKRNITPNYNLHGEYEVDVYDKIRNKL
jgi:dihydroorotase